MGCPPSRLVGGCPGVGGGLSLSARNVSAGAKADIAARSDHVRFPPERGHPRTKPECPPRANGRLPDHGCGMSAMGRKGRAAHLPAAGLPGLDWRACNRSVRTIDAAIARLRFQFHPAALAFIKPLACIDRHRLRFGMSAVRTGNDRLKLHGRYSTLSAGNPTPADAAATFSHVVMASS